MDITARTPHVIATGDIKTTNTVNVSYYDDTEIKRRLAALEADVSEIGQADVQMVERITTLENNETNWATQTEVQEVVESVEEVQTSVETIIQEPVGLSEEEMNQIFGD